MYVHITYIHAFSFGNADSKTDQHHVQLNLHLSACRLWVLSWTFEHDKPKPNLIPIISTTSVSSNVRHIYRMYMHINDKQTHNDEWQLCLLCSIYTENILCGVTMYTIHICYMFKLVPLHNLLTAHHWDNIYVLVCVRTVYYVYVCVSACVTTLTTSCVRERRQVAVPNYSYAWYIDLVRSYVLYVFSGPQKCDSLYNLKKTQNKNCKIICRLHPTTLAQDTVMVLRSSNHRENRCVHT